MPVLDDLPFFLFRDGTLVTPNHARAVLKNVLTRLNLNTEFYNCHSFRIGKSVDMQKMGYKISEIQQKGRWTTSNAVFRYLNA